MRWSLVILFTILIASGAAMAGPGDSWMIAGDNVNLRRGPGAGNEIKRQLSHGQRLIERERRGEWHHVEVVGADGLLGWVHGSLLTAPRSEPATTAPAITAGPATAPPGSAVARDETSIEPAADAEGPEATVVLDEMRDFVRRRDKLPKDPARASHSGREIISTVPIRKPGDQSRVPTELVLASSTDIAGIDPEAMEHFRDSVSYLNNRAWSVAGIKLFAEIEPVGGGVVQVKTTRDWFDVPEIGQTSYLNTLVDRWASAKADGAPAAVMLVDPQGDLLMHKSKP